MKITLIIILIFGKTMAKRQSWTPEEDKLITELISVFQVENKKIKWAQISQSLKIKNPEWCRTGKQCRERWLNHLRPSLSKTDRIDHIDLQQLFRLIRVHGKKWSLIAKELPGRTDNAIKNFFYAALRKGLRSLNLYNAEIRSQRRYKVFKQDLIDKLLSVHDQRKSRDLYISDSSVYDLADKIRQNFIRSSFDELKASSDLTGSLENFYEELNEDVMKFCRICKFKKSKGKRCDEQGDKYEIFTRKLKKTEIKLEQMPQSNMLQSQTTQQRQVKIEYELEVQEQNFYPLVKINSQAANMMNEDNKLWFGNQIIDQKNIELIELSIHCIEKEELDKNLFQMLSMPEAGTDSLEILY